MPGARRAALLLALLWCVGAERLIGPGARAATPGWWRRRPVAQTALLLGASGIAQGLASDVRGWFQTLDTDGDGSITRDEYIAPALSDLEELRMETIFRQADIDDDDELSMAELIFAGHIRAEESYLQRVRDGLPEGFIEGIDDAFQQLRSGSQGKVYLSQVYGIIGKLLNAHGNKLQQQSKELIRRFFIMTDVIQDGTLNNNELDFLHLVVRDSMVKFEMRHSAAAATPVITSFEGDSPVKVEAFFLRFDTNMNGRLELREAVEGVSELFGDTPEKREFYRGIVHWAFLAVDRDKTGSLGVNGVIKLFETLVSMAPAE